MLVTGVMASPLNSGKQAVNLAAKGVPGSRIRRDPPPKVKQTVVPDRDEFDRRNVAIGILCFTLAIVIAVIGISSATGWSPRHVTLEIDDRGGY